MNNNSRERRVSSRTVVSFIVAPLLGGLLFGVLVTWPMAIIIGLEDGKWSALPKTLISMIAIPFVGLVVTAPVMYLGMAIIGLPAMLLFRRIGLERWWTYGIWGAVWTVPLLLALGQPPAFWLAPAGGIILMLFWALARR